MGLAPHIFTATTIATLMFAAGCHSASSAIEPDIGSTYATPQPRPGMINGIAYDYVAPPERAAQIIEGFKRLRVGQNRQEVRSILGPPDRAVFSGGKAFDSRPPSWWYQYYVRMLPGGANAGNGVVDIFFDPGGGIKWATPQNIPGLKDVGSPTGP